MIVKIETYILTKIKDLTGEKFLEYPEGSSHIGQFVMPPEVNQRFTFYRSNYKPLMTSKVVEVTETEGELTFKTQNSIYQLKVYKK